MRLIPIIIPYYRAPEKLARCLAAIKAQTYTATEVFVRDNSDDNILYTAAVNEGLARYCYRDDIEMVMVLNQDAYLRPDAIAKLAGYMAEHPNCGIACPLQVDGTRVTWGGSYQAFPFGVHQCDPLDSYTAPFKTYWANGAAMMIRVSVVREVGLFDKNLRFIASDADFSFRARACNWKVMVVPDAVVDHRLNASASPAADAVMRIKTEDMIYFGEKWFNGGLYRALAHNNGGLTAEAGARALADLRAELGIGAGGAKDYKIPDK